MDLKLFFLIVFILNFNMSNIYCQFIEFQNSDTVIYSFNLKDFDTQKIGEYTLININNLDFLNKPYSPQIPGEVKRIKGFDTYKLLSIEYGDSIILDSIRIIPAKAPEIISPYKVKKNLFKEDSIAYNSNTFPSQWPIWKIKEIYIKSQKYSYVFFTPFKYYPKLNKVIIYKKIKIKFFKNIEIKPCEINKVKKRFLILTVDKYAESADSLIWWKTLTGFEAFKIIQTQWSVSEVKNTISEFYNAGKNDENYVVLIGDIEDIPSNSLSSDEGEAFYSDNPYFCMDGNKDYVPDLYYGRISVSSSNEALNVITKIIDYERSPSTNKTFYKTGVGAGYYSDGDDPDKYGNEVPPDGYADRRFVQTIEDIKLHLDSLGYEIKRVYSTRDDVNPRYWNNTIYSFGEPIPDYLKKPNFKWDGDGWDIVDYLNTGAFLLYHYDYGYAGGWADPYFSTQHISYLKNSKDLPIVFSINCLTGQFDKSICFAEKFLRHSKGGAVAIVAASYLSYSGYNEAFLIGMIDDIWPKITIKFPNRRTPQYIGHESEHILGKVFLDGLLAMEKSWSTWSSDYTFQIYHIFGDPSTKIFTKYPDSIKISNLKIYDYDTVLNLGKFNIKDGSVVLYNLVNKSVESVVNFNGSTEIKLNFPKHKVDDSLLLVISGVNIFPIVKKIYVEKGYRVSVTANKEKLGYISPKDTLIPEGGNVAIRIKAIDNCIISQIIVDSLEYYKNLSLKDTLLEFKNIKKDFTIYVDFSENNIVSIKEDRELDILELGPNPVHKFFNVYSYLDNLSLEVYNIKSGEKLIYNLKKGINKISVNSPGIYRCIIIKDRKILKKYYLTIIN